MVNWQIVQKIFFTKHQRHIVDVMVDAMVDFMVAAMVDKVVVDTMI